MEEAFESAQNAEGSALRENEKYLDSIQGRIDLFNNAVQTMWNTELDSDFIKGIVEFGTVLVKIIDKIGLLNTLLISLGTYSMIKNKMGPITFFRELIGLVPKGIKSIQDWILSFDKIVQTKGVSNAIGATTDLSNATVAFTRNQLKAKLASHELLDSEIEEIIVKTKLGKTTDALSEQQLNATLREMGFNQEKRESIIQTVFDTKATEQNTKANLENTGSSAMAGEAEDKDTRDTTENIALTKVDTEMTEQNTKANLENAGSSVVSGASEGSGVVGGAAGAKGVKGLLTKFGIGKAGAGAAGGAAAGGAAAGGALSSLAAAVPYLLAAVAAIGAIAWVVSKLNTTAKEAREKLRDVKNEVSSLKSEVDSLNSELDTTRDRIGELEALPSLSFTEQEELDRLKQTNEELERQLKLKEDLKEAAEERSIHATETYLDNIWNPLIDKAYYVDDNGVIKEDTWLKDGISTEQALKTSMEKYEELSKAKEGIYSGNFKGSKKTTWSAIIDVLGSSLSVTKNPFNAITELPDTLSLISSYSSILGNVWKGMDYDDALVEMYDNQMAEIEAGIYEILYDPDLEDVQYGQSDKIDKYLDDIYAYRLKFNKAKGYDVTSETISHLFDKTAHEDLQELGKELKAISDNEDLTIEQKNQQILNRLGKVDGINDGIVSVDKLTDSYQRLNNAMTIAGVTAQDISDYFVLEKGMFDSETIDGLARQYQKGIEIMSRLKAMDENGFFNTDDQKLDKGSLIEKPLNKQEDKKVQNSMSEDLVDSLYKPLKNDINIDAQKLIDSSKQEVEEVGVELINQQVDSLKEQTGNSSSIKDDIEKLQENAKDVVVEPLHQALEDDTDIDDVKLDEDLLNEIAIGFSSAVSAYGLLTNPKFALTAVSAAGGIEGVKQLANLYGQAIEKVEDNIVAQKITAIKEQMNGISPDNIPTPNLNKITDLYDDLALETGKNLIDTLGESFKEKIRKAGPTVARGIITSTLTQHPQLAALGGSLALGVKGAKTVKNKASDFLSVENIKSITENLYDKFMLGTEENLIDTLGESFKEKIRKAEPTVARSIITNTLVKYPQLAVLGGGLALGTKGVKTVKNKVSDFLNPENLKYIGAQLLIKHSDDLENFATNSIGEGWFSDIFDFVEKNKNKVSTKLESLIKGKEDKINKDSQKIRMWISDKLEHIEDNIGIPAIQAVIDEYQDKLEWGVANTIEIDEYIEGLDKQYTDEIDKYYKDMYGDPFVSSDKKGITKQLSYVNEYMQRPEYKDRIMDAQETYGDLLATNNAVGCLNYARSRTQDLLYRLFGDTDAVSTKYLQTHQEYDYAAKTLGYDIWKEWGGYFGLESLPPVQEFIGDEINKNYLVPGTLGVWAENDQTVNRTDPGRTLYGSDFSGHAFVVEGMDWTVPDPMVYWSDDLSGKIRATPLSEFQNKGRIQHMFTQEMLIQNKLNKSGLMSQNTPVEWMINEFAGLAESGYQTPYPEPEYKTLEEDLYDKVGKLTGMSDEFGHDMRHKWLYHNGHGKKGTAEARAVRKTYEDYAYNYFKEKGLDDMTVAAIMGNLRRESNFVPNFYDSEGDLFGGIAQLRGDRALKITELYGEDPKFYDQLDFIWEELTNPNLYKNKKFTHVLDTMNKVKTLEEKTQFFSDLYEQPNEAQPYKRTIHAMEYYNAYTPEDWDKYEIPKDDSLNLADRFEISEDGILGEFINYVEDVNKQEKENAKKQEEQLKEKKKEEQSKEKKKFDLFEFLLAPLDLFSTKAAAAEWPVDEYSETVSSNLEEVTEQASQITENAISNQTLKDVKVEEPKGAKDLRENLVNTYSNTVVLTKEELDEMSKRVDKEVKEEYNKALKEFTELSQAQAEAQEQAQAETVSSWYDSADDITKSVAFTISLQVDTSEWNVDQWKEEVQKSIDSNSDFISWDDLFTVDKDGKFKARADEFGKILKGMDNETRETFMRLSEAVKNGEKSWDQAMAEFNIDGLDRQFKLIDSEFESLNNDIFPSATDEINGLIDTLDELKSAFEAVASTMDIFKSAQEEMSQTGRVSIKTALELMSTTEDWDKILKITEDTIELIPGSEEELMEVQLKQISEQMNMAAKLTKEKLDMAYEAKAAADAFEAEKKAADNLNSAEKNVATTQNKANIITNIRNELMAGLKTLTDTAGQAETDFANNDETVVSAETAKTKAIGLASAMIIGLDAALTAFNKGTLLGRWGDAASAFTETYTKAKAEALGEFDIPTLERQYDQQTKMGLIAGQADTYEKFDKNYPSGKDGDDSRLENIQKKYESKIQELENQQAYIENENKRLEEIGMSASKQSYEELIAREEDKIALYIEERNELEQLLTAYDPTSEKYAEVANAIWEMNHAIQESTTSMIQNRKAIIDLYSDAFDKIGEAYDNENGLYDDQLTSMQGYAELLELRGGTATKGLYDQMIAITEDKIANNWEKFNEQDKFVQQLMAYRDTLDESSDEWIYINQAIINARSDMRGLKNEIQDDEKQVEQLKEEFKDLAITIWDEVRAAYDLKDQFFTKQQDLAQSYMDRLGVLNINVPDDALREMTNIQALRSKNFSNDYQQAVTELETLGEQVGKNDERYIEKALEVADLYDKYYDSETERMEYEKQILDNRFDRFNQLIDRMNHSTDTLQKVSDLLGDEDVATEDGEWTAEGLARLGVAHQQMAYSQEALNRINDEIEYYNGLLANGQISEKEYTEKMQELTDQQWNVIDAYENQKDAIVELEEARIDMIEEGLNKEAEAYQELIDLKKEELDAERDLYNFRKDIQKQTKDITALERKIASMSGSTDASTIAERTKLEAQLREAREGLDDTYYNHTMDSQSKALDDEMEAYSKSSEDYLEQLRESVKDTDLLIETAFNKVVQNGTIVLETLTAKADEYKVNLDDYLTSPWKNATIDSTTFATTANQHYQDVYNKVNDSSPIMSYNLSKPYKDQTDGEGATLPQYRKGVSDAIDGIITDTIGKQEELKSALSGGFDSAKSSIDTFKNDATGAIEAVQKAFVGENGQGGLLGSIKSIHEAISGTPNLNVGYTKSGNNYDYNLKSPNVDTSDPQVKVLQEILNDAFQISPLIKEDGKLGPATTNAIKQAQQHVNRHFHEKVVVPDGVYGNETRNAFLRYLTSKIDAWKSSGSSSVVGGGVKAFTEYKNKLPKAFYAKGTLGTTHDQFAITDESWIGEEITLAAGKNGQLQYLKKGSAVMPADISANLVEWGKLNPNMINMPNTAQGINMISNAVNKPEVNFDIESFLHIDNVSHDTLPELKKFVNEQLDKFTKQMNYGLRRIGAT